MSSFGRRLGTGVGAGTSAAVQELAKSVATLSTPVSTPVVSTPALTVPMLRFDTDGGGKRSRSPAAEVVRAAVLKRIDPANAAAMTREVLRAHATHAAAAVRPSRRGRRAEIWAARPC